MNNELTQVTEGIRKNPSLIVSLGIVAGTGATACLAAVGQRKTDKYLAEIEEELSKKEVVKRTWKNYIPAGLSFLATMGLVGVNQHFTNELAGEVATLTASLTVVAANKHKIESYIKDKYGEDVFKEMRDTLRGTDKKDEETAAEEKPATKKSQRKIYVEETGFGNEFFIEDFTGRAFYSSKEAVERGLKKFNDYLLRNQYATLNDLYRFLGLRETTFGLRHEWWCAPECHHCDPEIGVRFEITDGAYSEWYGSAVTYIDMPYDPPILSFDEGAEL